MKYKNHYKSNSKMKMEDDMLVVNLKRKIDIEEWLRFEEIADEEPSLWKVFWDISSDKEQIESNNICRNFYFNRFILSNSYNPLMKLTTDNQLTTDDIEIIFSLFLKMVPEFECENCDCVHHKV